jgi:hypothetical protein
MKIRDVLLNLMYIFCLIFNEKFHIQLFFYNLNFPASAFLVYVLIELCNRGTRYVGSEHCGSSLPKQRTIAEGRT